MTVPASPPSHAKTRRSRSSSNSERASLEAFLGDSDCVVQQTIRRYAKFARQCLDGSINKLHNRVGVDHGMFLYEEKCETTSVSSFVHEIYPGACTRHPTPTRSGDCSRSYQSLSRVTKLYAFGGGEIAGTLDDVMKGVYADNTDSHAINCAVQFGVDNVIDSGIMESFEKSDDKNPYRYFGVKWVEVENGLKGADTSDPDGPKENPVVDELYWIERTGIHTSKSGHKYGFHLFKTVETEYYTDDPSFRPLQMSVCYLYNQVENDVVHTFVRGIVEIPHSADSNVEGVVAHAGRLMLAPARVRQCERMRSILKMIEKSKTGRSEMLACRCSKVLNGLPRVDLCSDCREVMQQCKLLSVNDASERKHAHRDKARISLASTSSTLSDASGGVEFTAPSVGGMKLENKRGTVRQDGEVSDLDPEVLSLRMLLPIRECRATSNYREEKKKKGNVLLKMLLKYEDERRRVAADLVRPGND